MLKLPPTPTSLENIQNQHPNTKSSMKTNRNLPTSPLISQNPTPKPTQPNPEPAAPPFRSVSACNRCRLRKHRCDQRLPRCESCEKANVRCVGYDPLTKQEVPRSYVAFLESRVNYLNQVLLDHGIRFKPAIAYDEEETLKMEAGQVPFESLGLRKSALPTQNQTQTQTQTGMGMGTGARTSRKRKSHDSIPARQAKRLAQLNVLLTELLTDGCEHRQCSHRPDYAAGRHVPEDPIEQRLPWSPRSFDSVDHSDSRTTRSESVSSHEPYQYPRMGSGYGSSLFGAKSILGPDHGQEVHDVKGQPGFELDLVDFESGIANARSIVGGGKLGNTDVRHLNLSRASSEESRSSPEPKFDIAADLLRGRRERERANYDLLDEFLVDWAE